MLSPADISPVKNAFTATPVKITLRGLKSPFQESRYTSPHAKTPPKNANTGTARYSDGANAVTSTAAIPAPELIPMIPGSASGFFITA